MTKKCMKLTIGNSRRVLGGGVPRKLLSIGEVSNHIFSGTTHVVRMMCYAMLFLHDTSKKGYNLKSIGSSLGIQSMQLIPFH